MWASIFLASLIVSAGALDSPSSHAFLESDWTRDLSLMTPRSCERKLATCQETTPSNLPIAQWKAFLGAVEGDDSSLDMVREVVNLIGEVSFDGLDSSEVRSEIGVGNVVQTARDIQTMILLAESTQSDLESGGDVKDAALTVSTLLEGFLKDYGEALEASGLKPSVEATNYMAQTIFVLLHDVYNTVCSENPCGIIWVVPIIIPVLFLELVLYLLNVVSAYWYLFWHGEPDEGEDTETAAAESSCPIQMLECSFNRMSYAMVPALLSAAFTEASVH